MVSCDAGVCLYESVCGLVVMIGRCQRLDPGSIPGRRTSLLSQNRKKRRTVFSPFLARSLFFFLPEKKDALTWT
jgi:hypothetical protein